MTATGASPGASDPQSLARQLQALQRQMRRRHQAAGDLLASVHPSHRRSAANLLDYLTLRSHDVRQLQDGLAELGLSSLGRAEEHVMTTLERVLAMLDLLAGQGDGLRTEAAVGYGEGRWTLERNAESLLGPAPVGRPTRIMVTLPGEAADDGGLVPALVAAGMDVARVNAAHDDADCWGRMVDAVRRAADDAGRHVPVLVDLPGPKIRTGPVEPGPPVVRLRPRRDGWGRVTEPAHALLVPDDGTPGPATAAAPGFAVAVPGDGAPGSAVDAVLPVPEGWLAARRVGDRLELRDTRGSRRTFTVSSVADGRVVVEVPDTSYVATGTELTCRSRSAAVGPLPPLAQCLVLRPGDVLTLTADQVPARPRPGRGQRIACTDPQALAAVAVGHRVFIDDGRIAATAVALRPGEVDVRIVRAKDTGSRLRAEKGINLPDTDLHGLQLGGADEEALRFAAAHADLVGLSFVQRPDDVVEVRRRLAAAGGPEPGIVLKIETARGFAALPELLLAAMASARVGVMIARGDLAVECGFERMAEQQEEILALCDAGHVPVVWATEVLDRLARTGRPSRAEVSDAAMGGRAECVMLNKGPHVTEAVRTLDDILRRMSGHQRKNVTLLRRLRSWSSDDGTSGSPVAVFPGATDTR